MGGVLFLMGPKHYDGNNYRHFWGHHAHFYLLGFLLHITDLGQVVRVEMA